MRFVLSLLLAAGLVWPATAAPSSQILSRWVQMAPGGVAEARAVVQGASCPAASLDGQPAAMRVRAQPNEKFPVLLCSLTLVPSLKSASIDGVPLPLPRPAPDRIIVLGDTGCRINGSFVQDCNDPAGWPFPQVAARAAAMKPDLVIHVGDYLYRELPCPKDNAHCAGSPHGDNWETWNADFFAPGKPLLEAAPWAIVRGNHEECYRAGTGFLRLIGPLPVTEGAPCVLHVPPYTVPLGAVTLVVMDNASAVDCCIGLQKAMCFFSCGPSDDLVNAYKNDFAALPGLAKGPTWLAMHHPIWGVVELSNGMVGGGNATLIDAEAETGIPPAVDLMLAGHIHTFEAINYEGGLPPQLVVGEGGDRLDKAPPSLTGQHIGSVAISQGFSLPGYGFLLLTRQEDNRWQVEVFDAKGAKEKTCSVQSRRIACGA